MIHIHKDELDETDIKLITNDSIQVKESRIATFGLYQSRTFVCFRSFVVNA